jgi:four helix bundle protein
VQNYRNLDAWKKAHAMVLRTYEQTATFPNAERFGLTSQMRRAAVSVPANIAEGCYRGERSLAQSLRIALGSAAELEYYIILAADLNLLPDRETKILAREISDVKAVVTGLLKRVSASIEAEDHDKR